MNLIGFDSSFMIVLNIWVYLIKLYMHNCINKYKSVVSFGVTNLSFVKAGIDTGNYDKANISFFQTLKTHIALNWMCGDRIGLLNILVVWVKIKR